MPNSYDDNNPAHRLLYMLVQDNPDWCFDRLMYLEKLNSELLQRKETAS